MSETTNFTEWREVHIDGVDPAIIWAFKFLAPLWLAAAVASFMQILKCPCWTVATLPYDATKRVHAGWGSFGLACAWMLLDLFRTLDGDNLGGIQGFFLVLYLLFVGEYFMYVILGERSDLVVSRTLAEEEAEAMRQEDITREMAKMKTHQV